MDSLGTCLLQWVRTFEAGAGSNIENLADLSDGVVLWAVLREVDPEYFGGVSSDGSGGNSSSGALPEPEVTPASDWTRKWQNLKHVERQVALYYRDVCHGQDTVAAENTVDLKAIAAESSPRELEKLVMTILRAAMASPESNQKMVQKLMGMGKENATLIATELQNMEEVEYTETESQSVSRDESAYQSEQEMPEDNHSRANGGKMNGGLYEDPSLEREQELLQAQDTIAKLQQSQVSALRQIQELRQEKVRLQEAFDAYRTEIDTKGRRTGGDDAFKKLQRQSENDRAYIEDLENQMQSSRDTLDNYERQLQKYKEENETTQKLRDDVQVLKSDNDDLQQKIKANDNLKKKIQTLQEQEKTNVTLKEELKQAHERLEDLERLKHVQAGLEKEIIEKKGLIRNQEYQINELATIRKHAEYDARALAQKLQEARERQERDHEAIQDLQSRLQEANLDATVDIEPPEDKPAPVVEESKPSVPKNDEAKHLAEKLALMEQQLEAADARLKQAAERNAALEESARTSRSIDPEEREKIEQQTQEYEKTIRDLRRDLQTAQKQEADTPLQGAAALQRENHLMTTAWYDLSSRLQNNGMTLGRRRQEPKSWIGKQRALVGPGGGIK